MYIGAVMRKEDPYPEIQNNKKNKDILQ